MERRRLSPPRFLTNIKRLTGFNELFNVQYQNVTWIQQAADDCRELINKMHGIE